MYILYKNGISQNVDNQHDSDVLKASGWTVLSNEQVVSLGLTGLEQYIGPSDISVLDDGRLQFDRDTCLVRILPIIQYAKQTAITAGYDAAVAASLTMPTANPTAQDVAVGAAAFAAEDAEGLACIMQTHAARRDELLAALDAAVSAGDVAAVEAIDVNYAV